MFIVDDRIEAYAHDNTGAEPELLRELAAETCRDMEYPQMLTGRLEGRFLKLMVQLMGATRVIEIGTFTGYSALSMAEGLPAGGGIVTCEIDERSAGVARRYFGRSPHGSKITLRLGSAADTLATLESPFDLAFVDADKGSYPKYFELLLPLLRPGGVILFDNALWSGRVLDPQDDDTAAIDRLNKMVASDPRVENVLLTVRDGVNLVRKLP